MCTCVGRTDDVREWKTKISNKFRFEWPPVRGASILVVNRPFLGQETSAKLSRRTHRSVACYKSLAGHNNVPLLFNCNEHHLRWFNFSSKNTKTRGDCWLIDRTTLGAGTTNAPRPTIERRKNSAWSVEGSHDSRRRRRRYSLFVINRHTNFQIYQRHSNEMEIIFVKVESQPDEPRGS